MKKLNNKDWVRENVFFACSLKQFEEELAERGWKAQDVASLEGTLGFCHVSNVHEVIKRFGGVIRERK